jgi:hypothetical protein
LASLTYDNYKHKITNCSFYIQAKHEAEAQLEAEWQEMIKAIDQHSVLKDRELERRQR